MTSAWTVWRSLPASSARAPARSRVPLARPVSARPPNPPAASNLGLARDAVVDDIDHAAYRIAPILQSGRPAQDLQALDEQGIERRRTAVTLAGEAVLGASLLNMRMRSPSRQRITGYLALGPK
jgi:hypothetical protein